MWTNLEIMFFIMKWNPFNSHLSIDLEIKEQLKRVLREH